MEIGSQIGECFYNKILMPRKDRKGANRYFREFSVCPGKKQGGGGVGMVYDSLSTAPMHGYQNHI